MGDKLTLSTTAPEKNSQGTAPHMWQNACKLPLRRASRVIRPSGARESTFLEKCVRPTKSIMTSAPFPSVTSFTTAAKSSVL